MMLPGFPTMVLRRAASGLTMAGSIVFNGSNEDLRIASFSSSSPNQKTFTTSYWARLDDLGDQYVMAWAGDNGDNNSIFVDSAVPDIGFFDAAAGGNDVYAEFDDSGIDSGVWQHWVIAVDTTQGTAANRVRVYLDGNEVSMFAPVEPSLNDDCFMFTNGAHLRIGHSSDFNFHLDGRLADFIIVEGQQLTPSAFGYDNGGTWSWKDYTGAFGTHGFRINPQDSSQIGTDQSGNGNNFTLTNMDASNFDSGNLPPV